MKKQIKKSLSLFMAVLMVLSCWVWVAPTEAHADHTTGQYYVRLQVNLHTYCESMSGNVKLSYKKANGTGDAVTDSIVLSYSNGYFSENKEGSTIILYEGYVDGFPTDAKIYFYCSGRLKHFRLEDFCYYVGKDKDNLRLASTKDSAGKTDWKSHYGKGDSFTIPVYANTDSQNGAPYPYINSVTGAASAESKTIPSIGSNGEVKTTVWAPTYWDQYGVKWLAGADPSFYIGEAESSESAIEGTDDKTKGFYVSKSGKSAQVVINEKMQVNYLVAADTTTTKDYYLIASLAKDETKKIPETIRTSQKITVTYPTYTVTVNPKGSVTASDFNPTIILNNNSTQTSNWSYTGTYSARTKTYPTKATATGYTFKGFWTTKQPADGDAGINASEATFAAPVDQKIFDTYKAQEGATVDGSYVTLADGKKYYNAGIEWDGATYGEITGDEDLDEFFAWWVPQDITVKFYDIDGAFLGTKTAKYGTTPAADWYLNPKDGYNAGAYDYQGFAGKWRDITGVEVVEGSYTFGALEELSLTPIYTKKTYSDKYQVNFVDPDDGNNISGNSKEYEYRYILKDTDIPTVEVPAVLAQDAGFSYEFAGWTSQKPATIEKDDGTVIQPNYHTVAKDDTSITENTDWVVRDEITYYAIFRSTVKEYLVNFNYTDSTGAAKTESLVVPYGSAIATPNVVNRTYATTGGYGYTLEGWDYQTKTGATAMLGADATLVFNKDNVFVTTNNLAPSGTPIVFTANYDEGKPTPYTVTFKFKDAEGKDKVITDEVYHGYAITQDTVDRVTVPAQYDDGTALYTFSNLWKVTEGTADKAEYTKDEFTSFKPVSHVTFEALYGEGVPFYTVTYIDGAKKYEERVLAGKNVPAWLVEVDGVETEYAPSKADTETGKYNFEGWFDAEQTDKNFAQTNGTEYTTASIVNGDLVLYPQFKFEPFKFTIKFMNYNGTVQLAAAEVEAGKSFEAAFVEAQKAAQLRDADETYSYEFIGWDHKVPDNFLCEGKDMTYTALYKPNYIYYEANWYNDASMSGKPLATTKHTYNSSVYAPAVNFELPEAEEGKIAVFAGWKYLKDGVETDYVRGMKLTAGMSFYATYDFVDAEAETNTITTVVEGQENTTYNIVVGETAETIPDPADGYVNETNHRHFLAWYADAEYKTEFKLETVIKEDITIYAKFEEEKHSKTMKELVSVPTYYAMGTEYLWCACDKDATIIRGEDGKPLPQETIPMLTDTKAPTGTIYLGGHSWSSTGIPAYTTDNDPISIFVNANADIVITSNDTGDVNTAYNPSGIGKGVAKIRAFAFPAKTVLTADKYGAAESLAVDVYTNDTQDLNNNANFSIKVGDIFVADLTEDGEVQYDKDNNVKYKALEDGESYIIYYYVNDKANEDNDAPATGNQLNRLVRTAKFTYDNTPAEITVAGDSNAATATSTVTYCGKAVIKGIENGSTVLVNGEEVELTTSGAAGTSNYTITQAGNYVITVTDKAGNVSTKKIIVADGHDEIKTSKAVTCTEDGYDRVICAVCGKVIKNETIESEGHKYSAEVTVAPTCTEDGYTVKTCSVCGDEVKTPGEAKTGHTYNKDADGNVIYVTVTPSTCKVKGKAEAKCTVCGEGKLEKELDIDTVNGHKYGATKVLKATCTQDGEEYQNCKYCYAKKTVKVLEKLNHVGTGTYTKVTTAPTCYAEGVETTYCKGCDAELSTAPVAKVAHTLVLVKYEGKNNDDAANYPDGYMQYECKATGCTHTEGKTAITVKAEYTVTFVGADAEGADVVITKTEGESIEADAVADQTKAEDNEYTYTFKGWKAASTGKIVKLPIKVTNNETYTAEFTATKRIYTHTFKLDKNDEADFAKIIGTYNSENKKPAAIPTKAADDEYTYTFAGWKYVSGATPENFTMTEDATFVAEFTPIPYEFNVVFYNEDGSYIWSTKSTSTDTASYAKKDSEGTLVIPTKASDADNHYTFDKWLLGETEYAIDAEISVEGNARLYATYTAEAHNFDVVNDETKTWAATCTKKGQKTEKCSVCGYEKVTELPIADHNYVPQEDGSKVCSGCGDKIAPEAKEYTITFYDGEDVLKSFKVEEGKDKTYTAPEKADTAENDYTFLNWTDAEGNVVSEDAEITVTATADASYYANYTATTRTYTVTYIDSVTSGKVLQKTTGVAYGSAVPAYDQMNDEGELIAPTKAPDNNNHYVFAGSWSLEKNSALGKGNTIIGDTMFIADYEATKHTFVDITETEATCYASGKAIKKCKDCAYVSPVEKIIPATGNHTWYEYSKTEPTDTMDGSIVYRCNTPDCPAEKTSKIDKLTTTITIKVVDSADKAINGAVVTVTIGETTQQAQTAEGVASFTVDNTYIDEYEFTVEYQGELINGKVETGKSVTVKYESVTLPDDTDNDGADEDDANKCSCSCHRKNFWGILFRLLHKFLKLFTGKISCCSCPDPLY